jgi:hypothetical protein
LFFDLRCLDLAIGSELVYTILLIRQRAASKLLLRCNPNILIVIVQIADRGGCHDTFRPLVESINNADMECTDLPTEIHQHAALYQYVEQSGTMNAAVQDFEARLTSNKNEEGSLAHDQCL